MPLLNEMDLSTIKTDNTIEQNILEDLKIAQSSNTALSSIQDDLKDDPNAYNYTDDEFEQFCLKHNLPL